MDDGAQGNSGSLSSNVGSREIPNARIERGECPECGLKTHRVFRFTRPRPLTIPGYVLNGLCLLCNPIIGTTKIHNRHQIQKIMTDGEGSLVSALTFGPNEQNFEGVSNTNQSSLARRASMEQTEQSPSLIHTEISELVDEDEDQEAGVSKVFQPSKPLTVEEAMERGKMFAEEEDLSVRFSQEDMRKIRFSRCVKVADTEIVNSDNEMKPLEKNGIENRKSNTSVAVHQNLLIHDDKLIELNRKSNVKLSEMENKALSPESAFKARMSKNSSQPSKIKFESQPASADITVKSTGEDVNNLNTNLCLTKSGYEIDNSRSHLQDIHSTNLFAGSTASSPPEMPKVTTFQRSQSEGDGLYDHLNTYLGSKKLAYDGGYPDIPPPPLPNFEGRTTSMPVLTRFASEKTISSVLATTGKAAARGFSKPIGSSFDHFMVRQDSRNISERTHNCTSNEHGGRYAIDSKNCETKLQRFSTAPVGNEAVSTGVKKMVSFNSKPGSTGEDFGTSSTLSWCSDSQRGRPQSILKNKSVGSASSNSLRNNFLLNSRNSDRQSFMEDDHYDSDNSNTSISEKVKKMREEDESFIERKMREVFDTPEESEEKVLKTRLTQLGSSTSRDLDHAFVDYQLRKLNSRASEQEDRQSFSEPQSMPFSEHSRYTPSDNLSHFFQMNNLTHLQGSSSAAERNQPHSNFDERNCASLISDDDDEELLKNQTLLGMNNFRKSNQSGSSNIDFNRSPVYDFDHNGEPSSKSGFVTTPQDAFNQIRVSIDNIDPNPVDSLTKKNFSSQNSTNFNDSKKPPPDEMQKKQYWINDRETKNSQSLKQPVREASSDLMIKSMINSNSDPDVAATFFIRAIRNNKPPNPPLSVESLLLALKGIQKNAVKKEGKDVIFKQEGIKLIVETMWKYSRNCSVQIASCGALWAISTDSSNDQKTTLSNSGAAEAILCGMQGHLNNVDLLIQVCGVLGSFCLDEDKFNLMSMNVVATLAHIMELHTKNASLQIWGIRALWALCQSDSSGERIMEVERLNCVELVFEAMSINKDRELSEWGCRLLCCLSNNYVVLNKMLEKDTGVLKLAVQKIEEEDFDHALVCGLLSNLSHAIGTEGTQSYGLSVPILIKNTISVMRTNPSDVQIQAHGCHILSNVVAKQKEFVYTIMSSEGVRIVYEAMKSFSDNHSFEEQACSVLLSCAGLSEDKSAFTHDIIFYLVRRLVAWKYTQNTKVIGLICGIFASVGIETKMHKTLLSSGAIAVISDIMYQHQREAFIQESACAFMRNFTHTSLGLEVVNDNVIESLVTSMKENPNALPVQESACISLWNLSTGSVQRSLVVNKKGGIQAIIEAMQNHHQSEKMQEIACGSLWCLASNDNIENVEFKSAIKKNGVDSIICTMFTFPRSPAILENACGAISVLSVDHEIAQIFISSGGIDALTESMRLNKSNIRIVEYGCISLRNLIMSNFLDEQTCTRIIHVILRSMREHPHVKEVQKHACCALWSLTTLPTIASKSKKEILAGGGMDLIMGVLEHNEWDAVIHSEAREALETLIE